MSGLKHFPSPVHSPALFPH